jgi:hypothetical protein
VKTSKKFFIGFFIVALAVLGVVAYGTDTGGDDAAPSTSQPDNGIKL